MAAATFVLSLDCEGKWGMADHLTADHHRWITTANNREAYRKLLALFACHQIDVTFAFVMAFLLSAREQRDYRVLFNDQAVEATSWLSAFREAQAAGDLEGWSMPELLDMVREHPGHEIGCHGFSHLPLAETMASAQVVRHELEAAATVASERKLNLRTLIYPRNMVGYTSLLPEYGYVGFRDNLSQRPGRLGRALNLVSEFNTLQRPQPDRSADGKGLVVIPPGFFFNWRSGLRRRVPKVVTVRRWRRMLERAAANGGVVHLWLHPHNIISAPETFDVLATVLRHVADLRDRGLLLVQTQQDYCADHRPTNLLG